MHQSDELHFCFVIYVHIGFQFITAMSIVANKPVARQRHRNKKRDKSRCYTTAR
jgi:hypothetical protein